MLVDYFLLIFTKILSVFPFSSIRATDPAHLIPLDLAIPIILGEEYTL
jgi:hypothetical protein